MTSSVVTRIRLEDIAALGGNDWQSKYLLGCLYMDRRITSARSRRGRKLTGCTTTRRPSAIWRRSTTITPDAVTTRGECLRRRSSWAASRQTMARILYELVMLYKSSNVSVDERVKLLEANLELTCERDDCCLEYIILLVMQARYDDAERLLGSRRFNIYEGGEGKLTRHHGWLYLLMAHAAASTAS